MNLYEKLSDDVKSAMKSGDPLKVSVLRMALSALKMIQIEKNIKTIDDDAVLQVLQKHVRQHRESIEQFDKGGRPDLSDKEKAELKILESYLPAQLSEEDLTAIIKAAVSETGAAVKSDTGKVMKVVMEKAKGKADGKTINRLVQQFLK